MRWIFLFGLLALPLAAEPLRRVALEREITFGLPEGFHLGYEAEEGRSALQEFVLKDETVRNWSQMITLTGARDWTGGAEGFAQAMAGGFQTVCPQSFLARGLDRPAISGVDEVFAGFLACGDNGEGRMEAVVFAVFTRGNRTYTLQWAELTPATAQPAFDPARWYPRLATLTEGAKLN